MNAQKPRKPLPLPLVLALIVVGALLLAAGGYFLVVGPKRAEAAELATQIDAKQQQIDDFNAASLAAKHVKPIHVADLFHLSKAMPDRADMPGVLLELNRVAADSGITFESISPQTSAPISGYQAVPIHLNFSGNFYDLVDFVYRLRNLVSVHGGTLAASGRLFAIDTIDFSEATEGFPQIEAVLVVDAFVYGTGAPASATPTTTAAATGGGTTATTTTTAPTDTTAAAIQAGGNAN